MSTSRRLVILAVGSVSVVLAIGTAFASQSAPARVYGPIAPQLSSAAAVPAALAKAAPAARRVYGPVAAPAVKAAAASAASPPPEAAAPEAAGSKAATTAAPAPAAPAPAAPTVYGPVVAAPEAGSTGSTGTSTTDPTPAPPETTAPITTAPSTTTPAPTTSASSKHHHHSDDSDDDNSSSSDSSSSDSGPSIGGSVSVGGVTAGVNVTGALPAPSAQVLANRATRPYFNEADWLWEPIPAIPVLDANSAAIGSALGDGSHVADLAEYGVALRDQGSITASTPRFDVNFGQTGNWGPDPFGNLKVPIPAGTPVPAGGDGALSILDQASGQTYNLFVAKNNGSSWTAEWGALAPIAGDGRETSGGSSTGAGLARFGAVVRASEITAGAINHALFFSTNMASKSDLRYPAVKTDGSNDSGSSATIPEGARVQLDPSIDLSKIPGITPFELTVGRALQQYGAYAGDNGGARVAVVFEYVPGLTPYTQAGAKGDYDTMPHIPWDKLRVLRQADGG